MKTQLENVKLHRNAFYANLFYLNQRDFFNENEHDSLYPSISVLPVSMGLLMRKYFSKDSFPKLRPTVSSLNTSNYDLARYFCDTPNYDLARYFCDLYSPLLPSE